MNERIQELWDQCKTTNWSIDNPEYDHEKFAELIVLECIEVCKSRVGNSDYTTGRMHCVSDLKEHFELKNERK
jgi:hypothetical protein